MSLFNSALNNMFNAVRSVSESLKEFTHTVTSEDTITSICSMYQVSIEDLIRYNKSCYIDSSNFNYNYYEELAHNALRYSVGYSDDEEHNKYTDADKKAFDYDGDGRVTADDARSISRLGTVLKDKETLGDFLSAYPPNYILPYGLTLVIKELLSGGLENNEGTNITSSSYFPDDMTGSNIKVIGDSKKFNSYFIRYAHTKVKSGKYSESKKYDDKISKITYLPVVPEEFSDTNTANFTPQSLYGRSVDYQVYTGSSRSVSFSLVLHEELVEDIPDYVRTIVKEIESCCYPEYGDGGVISPPSVEFHITDQFNIRGVLSSCSATWTPPYSHSSDNSLSGYRNCNLSISITETTGPYSMSDISSKGGFRG